MKKETIISETSKRIDELTDLLQERLKRTENAAQEVREAKAELLASLDLKEVKNKKEN